MAMVVKNNMSAVRTLNTLNMNSTSLQKSLQKVSSGMKINSAQDDASGYAISERMRVRIRSLDQANQNTQNDSSLMKTAEGAVGNTVEILRALKEKAINAANDSNTDEDRQTIQKEINQFIDQIDDNALVQFNGKYLVDGSKNNASVASKTILLNQSLKLGTKAGTNDSTTGKALDDGTKLIDMANRAGDSLGIQSTDKWQVSWVQNGTIHTASGNVGEHDLNYILQDAGINKDIGKAAVTAKDGLIDDTDANLMPGYTEVGTTAAAKIKNYAVTDKMTWDDITAAFKGVTDADGNAVDFSTEGTPTSVTYYKEDPNGGDPIAVELTIADSGQTDGGTTPKKYYTVTGADNLKGVSIYTKDNTTDPYLVAFTAAKATTGYDSIADAAAALGIDSSKIADGAKLNAAGTFYTDDGGGEKGAATAVPDTYTFQIAGGKIFIKNGTGATDFAADGTKFYKENNKYDDGSIKDVNVKDKFDKAVYTPDKTQGIAFVASEAGVVDQISGLTISIMDQDGNVKKAANAALDQFKQYQRAENQTGDKSLNFHIGSEANVAIKVGMSDMRSEALGLKGSDGSRVDVFTKEHANAAINVIENALTKALDQQTTIGAIEARLEYTSTNLTTSSENVQAAESTIRDADMAKEMTNYTKSNVLLQAAQAMLAQANQNSSAVLSLLQ